MEYQNAIGFRFQRGFLILLILGIEITVGLSISVFPPLSVAFIASLSIIILALINPNIGIAALILAIPFAFGSFNLNLTEIYTLDTVHVMLFCLIFLYLLSLTRGHDLQFSRSPIDVYFPLFLSWAALSIIWSPNFFTAMIHLFSLVSIFLLYYVTYFSIQNIKSLEYIIWGWWLVGISFFFVGIMQYFGILAMKVTYLTGLLEGSSRVTGFSSSPSAFARVMILTFFTMLGAYQFFKTRIKKLTVGICLIFSLIIIVLTLSRSAFIGIFFGIIFYTLRYLRKTSGKYILFIVIFCVTFFAFGLFSGIDFKERIDSILHFYKEGAWIIRLSIWAASFKMFFDTYGLGVGLGGIENLFNKYYESPFPVGSVPPHAHSLYIDVLTHFGFIGFFLFILVLITLAIYLYRTLKEVGELRIGKMLWAFCCGLLSIGIQLSITGLLHVPELWIYIGMIAACAKIAEREISLKNQNIRSSVYSMTFI